MTQVAIYVLMFALVALLVGVIIYKGKLKPLAYSLLTAWCVYKNGKADPDQSKEIIDKTISQWKKSDSKF